MRFAYKNYPINKGGDDWWAVLPVQLANPAKHSSARTAANFVVCTDILGNVTFLNPVAEKMTGWSCQEAAGRSIGEVLRILDDTSREPVANPIKTAAGRNVLLHLPPNGVLVQRNGLEIPIEHSIAPIHDREGQATAAVIVFRDVRAARAMALQMTHSAQHDFYSRHGADTRRTVGCASRTAILLSGPPWEVGL